MHFDTDSTVIQLCIRGIETEGAGDIETARSLYEQAWELAANDTERFTAAHYLARHQNQHEQLKWNQLALDYALRIKDDNIKSALPSLYLNLGKSHEDIEDTVLAAKYYRLADECAVYLADDGYGRMTRSGIEAALKRVNNGDNEQVP